MSVPPRALECPALAVALAEPDVVDDEDEASEVTRYCVCVPEKRDHPASVFIAAAETFRQRIENDEPRRNARGLD